uniref:Uncharacterized protein n=1 Tax=Knipowitschia caucasica TaxID=637954 RepID=A0AAV2JSX5_KNICA
MAEAPRPSTGKNSARLGSSGTGGVRVPQEPSLKVGVVLDERVDFLREQAFCVLRVKTDKWNRFIGAEENQKIILDFLDHIWTNRLLLFTGPGGTLHAGDAQVLVSVLSNGLNHEDWPRVVSEDTHRHLEKLRSNVVTLRGRAEGRTLLPLPLCVERAQTRDIAVSGLARYGQCFRKALLRCYKGETTLSPAWNSTSGLLNEKTFEASRLK